MPCSWLLLAKQLFAAPELDFLKIWSTTDGGYAAVRSIAVVKATRAKKSCARNHFEDVALNPFVSRGRHSAKA
jgi:hypothetical protein